MFFSSKFSMKVCVWSGFCFSKKFVFAPTGALCYTLGVRDFGI